MLYGENGSGKSTILDAIDVVCNGTVGSLGDISVGQNSGKYLCAVDASPSTLRAVIYSETESWTGVMRRNTIEVTGPANKPQVKILRRGKILDLILAQPSERYRALQHFLDIGVVEQSEGTLQQKINDINHKIQEDIASKERMTNQLENLWEAENRPGPGTTAMSWAKNKVEIGISGHSVHLEKLSQLVTTISTIVRAAEIYNSWASDVSSHNDKLMEVEGLIQQAPSFNAATTIKLLESLEKAKAYIEAEEALDKCPTCLRPTERDELLQTVSHEFSKFSDLKSLIDKRVGIQNKLDIATSNLNDARNELINNLQKSQSILISNDIPEVTRLNIQWPSWIDRESDISALLRICKLLSTIQAEFIEQRNTAQRDVIQFNSIAQWWSGIDEANHRAEENDRILTGLNRAHDIVHNLRVSFVQNILDSISQEANRLFQTIHPGEDIGLERLKIEEERRSSISQSGIFHGHNDIPPQAVFSDSHMDTLGFCVWLALTKRESPEKTVLLIDDIFTSVDSPHLGRVIDLISSEANNFLQVIVATHYRLWWDRCQGGHGIQRIHLGHWCIENGLAAQNMPLLITQLRQLIDNPILDRQAVSSKAGILLESVMDDLALLYECSLPYNKLNQYTLGALLDGCKKLFKRHNLNVRLNLNFDVPGQPENWQTSAAHTAFDKVNTMQFIRNQVGCHFSPPGMDIPDNDVREFGMATIELFEALTCPHCGCIASKVNMDGTALRCSCRKQAIQMTPVKVT